MHALTVSWPFGQEAGFMAQAREDRSAKVCSGALRIGQVTSH